jgi:hypothetical protein
MEENRQGAAYPSGIVKPQEEENKEKEEKRKKKILPAVSTFLCRLGEIHYTRLTHTATAGKDVL